MFDVYRSNFITLVGIMAVVQVPINIVGMLITELPRKPIPGAGLFYILVALAAGFLTLAAATWAVSEVYLGRRVSIRTAYKSIWPRAAAFMGTYALYLAAVSIPGIIAVIIIFIGAAVTVVGAMNGTTVAMPAMIVAASIIAILALGAFALALIVYVWFVFSSSVFIVEDKRYISSLLRSRQLVQGHWWRLLGIILLVGFIYICVYAAFIVPTWFLSGRPSIESLMANTIGSKAIVLRVADILISMILSPIIVITTILLYYDLRIRKEGFDLQVLAAEMGYSELPVADVSHPLPVSESAAEPASGEQPTIE
ncbi:MAG: hypothetical protein Q7N50_12100, partial [Armatimonadota bacterium]|nr:hypothetical protein [Armatimonadota bacterium]